MSNLFSSMPPIKLLVKLYQPSGERLAKRPDKPPYYVPPPTPFPTHQGRKLFNDNGKWIGHRSRGNEGNYYSRDVFRIGLDKPEPQTIEVLGNRVILGSSRSHKRADFPGGNLQKHYYFYWVGSRLVSNLEAICRVCHKMCWGAAERRKHFEFGDCGRIMVEASKRFQANKDKFCGCGCGKEPKIDCWGLGFKEAECMERFSFEISAMSPLLTRFILNQQKLSLAAKGLG